jgi:hypothetical protein
MSVSRTYRKREVHLSAQQSELSLVVVAKYNSYLSKEYLFSLQQIRNIHICPQRHFFARFHYFCLKLVFVMNRAEILLHFLSIHFYGHSNTRVPGLWIKPQLCCKDWRIQLVCYLTATVCVACKQRIRRVRQKFL